MDGMFFLALGAIGSSITTMMSGGWTEEDEENALGIAVKRDFETFDTNKNDFIDEKEFAAFGKRMLASPIFWDYLYLSYKRSESQFNDDIAFEDVVLHRDRIARLIVQYLTGYMVQAVIEAKRHPFITEIHTKKRYSEKI